MRKNTMGVQGGYNPKNGEPREITQEELVGESGQKILKELFDKYLKANK